MGAGKRSYGDRLIRVSTPVIVAIVVLALVLWALLWIPVRTRTRSYTTTTEINRHPDDVFSFVVDLQRSLPILTGGVVRGGASQVGPGTRFTTDAVMGSVDFVEQNEVMAFDPPRRFAWREAGFSAGTESIELAAAGEATRVSHTYQATERYFNSVCGLALAGPLLSWAGARERRKSWARIKQELESGRSA